MGEHDTVLRLRYTMANMIPYLDLDQQGRT